MLCRWWLRCHLLLDHVVVWSLCTAFGHKCEDRKQLLRGAETNTHTHIHTQAHKHTFVYSLTSRLDVSTPRKARARLEELPVLLGAFCMAAVVAHPPKQHQQSSPFHEMLVLSFFGDWFRGMTKKPHQPTLLQGERSIGDQTNESNNAAGDYEHEHVEQWR